MVLVGLNVTRPEKTGVSTQNALVHIMASSYILFCMCYAKAVSFIEFLIDFCMYDDIKFLDTLLITDKKILHFKLSQLG